MKALTGLYVVLILVAVTLAATRQVPGHPWVTTRRLPAGHQLTTADLVPERPSSRAHDEPLAQLVGRHLLHAVAKGTTITRGDLSPRPEPRPAAGGSAFVPAVLTGEEVDAVRSVAEVGDRVRVCSEAGGKTPEWRCTSDSLELVALHVPAADTGRGWSVLRVPAGGVEAVTSVLAGEHRVFVRGRAVAPTQAGTAADRRSGRAKSAAAPPISH